MMNRHDGAVLRGDERDRPGKGKAPSRRASALRCVPCVVSAADTLASVPRFSRVVGADRAGGVIRDAPDDFAGLPAFATFLD
jgi:hypothetical protein